MFRAPIKVTCTGHDTDLGTNPDIENVNTPTMKNDGSNKIHRATVAVDVPEVLTTYSGMTSRFWNICFDSDFYYLKEKGESIAFSGIPVSHRNLFT